MTVRSLVYSGDARQDAAANWVLRLEGADVSEAVVAEWLAWCDADARNRAAFDRMAAMWDAGAALERPEEGREAPAAAAPVSWRGMAGRRPMMAIAASIALLVVAGSAFFIRNAYAPHSAEIRFARFETPVGVTQAATLSDGSKIELGGRTALTVRYSDDARMIAAEQGEAYFQVAKNRERPFVVQAGPVTAIAVGTAFSVERAGDTVVVSVTEGIVEVQTNPSVQRRGATAAPIVLRAVAGNRVRFDRGELVQAAEPHAAIGPWKAGNLEFRDEPLRLIVARINRYSDVQLEISDPSISDLRVTTTIDRQHIGSWLKGIEMVLPIRVSRPDDKSAVISPAA